MRPKRILPQITPTILALALFAGEPAAAQQEKVLHSFGNGTDGTGPDSLLFDAAGNLFGTTINGGALEGQAIYTGTAFELSPLTGGGWKETILHSFGGRGDGQGPGGLISDAAGNLYGTTQFGGDHYCPDGEAAPVGPGGCGIVFQLRPPVTKGGVWTERILYDFKGGNDGSEPNSALAMDSSGNLYGTSSWGGGNLYAEGAAFELSPTTQGYWTFKLLHEFNTSVADGFHPSYGLILDASGDLYGTTCDGGAYQGGIAFELLPMADGKWAENILYSFNASGTDGTCPSYGITFDSSGNLYGTTIEGGTDQYGTVFELTPSGSGPWKEQVLHNFEGGSGDGENPFGAVLFDTSGNLYGTTAYGGTSARGTVFKLAPGGGIWSETILHNFGSGTDGQNPGNTLLMDFSGDLFGTTQFGGAYQGLFGSGTVFEIRP